MKIFPDEAPHILFDLFRVRFSANYSNQKIIGVPKMCIRDRCSIIPSPT